MPEQQEPNKQTFDMPPIYKVTEYALSQSKKIKMMTYVPWPGTNKKKQVHRGLERTMFIGWAMINRGDQQAPIEFPIPAVTIHQAANMFHSTLESILVEMNKPNIITPGGDA